MRLTRKIAIIHYTEIVGDQLECGEMKVEYKNRFGENSAETVIRKTGKFARVDSYETGEEVYNVPDEIAVEYRQYEQ